MADMLSRIVDEDGFVMPISTETGVKEWLSTNLDNEVASEKLMELQSQDKECKLLKHFYYSGQLPKYVIGAEKRMYQRIKPNLLMDNGLLYFLKEDRTDKDRDIKLVVIPKVLRLKIIDNVHREIGHFGVDKVTVTLRDRVYWPLLGQDVLEFCENYELCQRHKKKKTGKVHREMVSDY